MIGAPADVAAACTACASWLAVYVPCASVSVVGLPLISISSESLLPSITVDPASVEPPFFVAALDAWDTVMVCLPNASKSSDLRVEIPSAPPPAATNIDACAATDVVVLVIVFVDRTLPTLASWSTVNDSVPLKLPFPAVTPAMASFDDAALSEFHAAGRASASVAVVSPERSVRISA